LCKKLQQSLIDNGATVYLTRNTDKDLSLTKYLKEIRDPKYNNTYYMYKNITPPGVLIEVGFISNPDDRYRNSFFLSKHMLYF